MSINYALASNGGVSSASQEQFSGRGAAQAIDNNFATDYLFFGNISNCWLRSDFSINANIIEVVWDFSVDSSRIPTGAIVEFWNGLGWANQTSLTQIAGQAKLHAIVDQNTTAIRVRATGNAVDGGSGYLTVAELQAWGTVPPPSAGFNLSVSILEAGDTLVVTDQSIGASSYEYWVEGDTAPRSTAAQPNPTTWLKMGVNTIYQKVSNSQGSVTTSRQITVVPKIVSLGNITVKSIASLNLAAGVSFKYRVRALDARPNRSGFSNQV